MWGRSRCKMGSPDLHELAAARTLNLYACRSSALFSLSVTLMCIRVANAQRRCFTASRYTKFFELGVRQLAACVDTI
jgi:hypothetical protein